MQSRKLTFPNADGQELAAVLDLPATPTPRACALFAHCFTCSKNVKAAHHISRGLTETGIAVLRFDFTGLGESEGEFANTNFSSNVADLVAAADYLEAEYQAPEVLVGHSLGGAAVLMAGEEIPSTRVVATIAAPADPAHVAKHLETRREEIEKNGEAEVRLGGRTFRVRKQFLDDLEGTRMEQAIRSLRRKAILVFHSPVDRMVGIDNAAKIYAAAIHPKSFISLDTADHLLSDPADSVYCGTAISALARKYLTQAEAERAGKETAVSGGADETVVRTGRDHYRTEISAAGHPMLADEPESHGGTNAGPSPFDYISAGLGACTSMTLRMYADRKEWPLEGAKVYLKHGKVHADECTDCETEKGKVDQFTREIELEGDLTEKQRQRLLEIADRCPVHRTLHSEIKVRSRLRS
jgi:putative redox protein